jgi:chemotaxis response regulator CheB
MDKDMKDELRKILEQIPEKVFMANQATKKEHSALFMDFKERLVRMEEKQESNSKRHDEKHEEIIRRLEQQNGKVFKNAEKINMLEKNTALLNTTFNNVYSEFHDFKVSERKKYEERKADEMWRKRFWYGLVVMGGLSLLSTILYSSGVVSVKLSL